MPFPVGRKPDQLFILNRASILVDQIRFMIRAQMIAMDQSHRYYESNYPITLLRSSSIIAGLAIVPR